MSKPTTSRRIPLIEREWDHNDFALFTKEPLTYLAFNMDVDVMARIVALHNKELAQEIREEWDAKFKKIPDLVL